MREIPSFLHLTAAEGGWRVVIVDGAEDMNIASANAILKMLEEPPPRAVLMLVSAAPGRLLPTIRSRCRQLALTALSPAEMRMALAATLPDMVQAERDALARLTQGAPGRALALAERGGLAITALVDEIMGALPDFKLLRGYEMADLLRDEVAFDLFFGLLRQAISDGVRAQCRGGGQALGGRSAAEWCAIWSRMGDIHADADRHNLDKRQAVITALGSLV